MTDMKKTTQIMLLILAVLLVIAGVIASDHIDVMTKAVMICMECIGIG